MTQGAQTQCSVTAHTGGMGRDVGGRYEHMYTNGWFMLMYGRDQHNIVKQLSFN